MRYQKALDIWRLTDKQIQNLQTGQWIYGGNDKNLGRFLGVKKSGTVVVAWQGNASFQKSYIQYIKQLLNYAKAN